MSEAMIIRDVDIGLFLTFCMVLFGALQWLAVQKQNDQNLFKFRMDYYDELYTKSTDLLISMQYYVPERLPIYYNYLLEIKTMVLVPRITRHEHWVFFSS